MPRPVLVLAPVLPRFFLVTALVVASACSDSNPALPADASAAEGGQGGERRWSALVDGLDRVPLCVWGSSSRDVWVGGGGLASVRRTLLLHDVGRGFEEASPSGESSIWWIHGSSAADVWAVGENGLALHWDGATWLPAETSTTATLYGVWAAAPDDVWAVGGSPSGGDPNDVLLHFDGVRWQAVAPPSVLGLAYFKVWGASANDVHVVGQAGIALHYDGSSWSVVPTGAKATIFTVHGAGGMVRAIGGPPPTLLSWSGGSWEREEVPPEMSGTMTGIFVDASGTVFMTGEQAQRFERDASGRFTNDTDSPPSDGEDLHAVWGDGQGNAIAVGGNYVALTRPGVLPSGVVARYSAQGP